jgi:hypothetical protein
MGQTWTRGLLLLLLLMLLLLLGMQHMNSSCMQVIRLLVAAHQQLQQHSKACHPHQSGPGLHLSSGAGQQQLQQHQEALLSSVPVQGCQGLLLLGLPH